MVNLPLQGVLRFFAKYVLQTKEKKWQRLAKWSVSTWKNSKILWNKTIIQKTRFAKL